MRRLLDGLGPRDLSLFPYPNGPEKVRFFSVLDPLDEAVLRAATGPVATAVERALSETDGVRVVSSRLSKPPPGWTLRDPIHQDGRRRDLARARIEDPSFRGLGLTDITAYYPSIPIDRLTGVVQGLGADPAAHHVVDRWLREWHRRGQLRGLPIGPQAAGIYGNAYLIPLDTALAMRADQIIRLTDDYWVFVDGKESWDALLDEFDRVADALSLQRNESKTQFIDAPGDAAELIEDLEGSSVAGLASRQTDSTSRLDMFFEAVGADDVTRARLSTHSVD
jgi:Reverse transcriptase (RNA-dependent DNA polymerase)